MRRKHARGRRRWAGLLFLLPLLLFGGLFLKHALKRKAVPVYTPTTLRQEGYVPFAALPEEDKAALRRMLGAELEKLERQKLYVKPVKKPGR